MKKLIQKLWLPSLAFTLVGGRIYFKGGTSIFQNYKKIDQSDRVVLITGGTDGIGFQTALNLSDSKTIIIAGRDEAKGKRAIEKLKELTGKSNYEFMKVDLSDLNSVEQFCGEFAKKHQTIHTLINNAGQMLITVQYSPQGYERNFSTNYLGHFLLTDRLTKLIKDEPQSRIINVASRAHLRCPINISFNSAEFDEYFKKNSTLIPASSQQLYPVSKLCNILFTNKLQQVLGEQKKQIQVYSLHPGLIRTQLMTDFLDQNIYARIFDYFFFPFVWYCTKNLKDGARTQTYLAEANTKDLINGAYYRDGQLCDTSKEAKDPVSRDQLWVKTIELLRMEGYFINQ